MIKLKYSFLLLVLLYLYSCRHNKGYTSKPARSATQVEEAPEISALAYHINDSVTEIFVEIKNENLLYKRPDTSQVFYANLRFFYKLAGEPGNKKLLDTGTIYMSDRSVSEVVTQKSLTLKFRLKAFTGNNYNLELETLDKNKKTRYITSLGITKQTAICRQSFLLTLRDTVVYRNYFSGGDVVKINFELPNIQRVHVDCFLKEFGPAAPPFSTKAADEQKFKPDSSFVLNPAANQFTLAMPYKGFLHVRYGDGNNESLVNLCSFDASYPGLGGSKEMINSTRYIMGRSEFENCIDATEQKSAIDNFWLSIGGSNERARELLKRYYSRVTETNKVFKTYTQGWKSDRGMIFIVFGPPTNLYKSSRDEVWVYGNEANPASLRFVFNKTANPYSENDYLLERSQFYKDAWYSAVDYWRQGNVYLDSKR